MLSGNFVYSHAIEITIALISYANMSSDFLCEALVQTAVTFRTSKYIQKCYEIKIIRTTVSRPTGVYLLKQ